MAVMDEFREEREALKYGTPREKFEYFWYYYKWYVIGGIFAIAAVVSMAHSILSQKDSALYVATINCSAADGTDEYEAAVAEYIGVDLDEYDITFDVSMYYTKDSMDENTYTTVEKLAVYTAAAELDAMMAGGDAFEQYANGDVFYDLREILTDEQIAVCEPYFYYVDQAVVDERNRISDELGDVSTVEIPDPRHPEEMEDPVPVGIYVADSAHYPSEELTFRTDDTEAGIAIAVYRNTEHLDNTVKYLSYLIEGLPAAE